MLVFKEHKLCWGWRDLHISRFIHFSFKAACVVQYEVQSDHKVMQLISTVKI
jgi:hypothetical protein